MKDGHVAEARVRRIEGIGIELRFEWNGDLGVSQVFKPWDALEASASERRQDLKARGWHSELKHSELEPDPVVPSTDGPIAGTRGIGG
jgi:hypothetical protein